MNFYHGINGSLLQYFDPPSDLPMEDITFAQELLVSALTMHQVIAQLNRALHPIAKSFSLSLRRTKLLDPMLSMDEYLDEYEAEPGSVEPVTGSPQVLPTQPQTIDVIETNADAIPTDCPKSFSSCAST